jgi:small subunit ribosomal protein S7
MPRRKTPKKREIQADPVYSSRLVTKFINNIMRRGKKTLACRIFYRAMEIVGKRSGKPPMEVFEQAIENTRPHVAVKPRRVGGATYQVPIEVPKEKGISMAIKWIIVFAKARKGKPMEEKLASELIDAFNNTGGAVKKKDDTHRMAEANRAFIHYRW